MKRLKQRAIYYTLLLVLGAVMLICALAGGQQNDMMFSTGCVMVLVCAIKLLQLHRLSRNPEAGRKMDLACTEERTVFIANKAAKATLFGVVGLQYAAMLAALFVHRNEAATLLGFLVCAQLLLYVGFSRYYSQKF